MIVDVAILDGVRFYLTGYVTLKLRYAIEPNGERASTAPEVVTWPNAPCVAEPLLVIPKNTDADGAYSVPRFIRVVVVLSSVTSPLICAVIVTNPFLRL